MRLTPRDGKISDAHRPKCLALKLTKWSETEVLLAIRADKPAPRCASSHGHFLAYQGGQSLLGSRLIVSRGVDLLQICIIALHCGCAVEPQLAAGGVVLPLAPVAVQKIKDAQHGLTHSRVGFSDFQQQRHLRSRALAELPKSGGYCRGGGLLPD